MHPPDHVPGLTSTLEPSILPGLGGYHHSNGALGTVKNVHEPCRSAVGLVDGAGSRIVLAPFICSIDHELPFGSTL